ncbi:MAG: flagellar export chaperone FlgN [Planctomycetota bacterium]|jgi:hypothetical protein
MTDRSRSRRGAAITSDVAALLRALEQQLSGQLEDYRELLDCLQRKRAAIRNADVGTLEQTSVREQRVVQRCAEREPRRRELLRSLAAALAPDRSELTVRELAERVDEPHQTRLLGLSAQLREVAAEARAESSVVRVAAEALGRHLGGVMQTMQSALGRAQVYGQRGRLAGGAQVQFNVDVRT